MAAARPRQLVIDALADELPTTLRVVEYARQIDPPTVTTVMVRVDNVTPHPATPQAQRRYGFALIILAAKSDPTGPADDELDAALEDVLYAIERSQTLPQWTSAERAVYADTTPAYQVNLPVDITK